ncbi:hypothetical protein A2574_00240 [Candidatus Shapirobacteria bacterium RIFOXYD1_FULL_38_32]|uniref:Uncharacterized protein n=3 Tax=Candidatus Shapironibacteriota TaxID=1752721 RepID=A0A0G0K277_9BACT|nr:MAG: hypothetical protein US90_C0015G0023 [Candidatus Shapirobacteria bacterium GW2011_GWE2_38_30]KKQ90773.1 MAG: hypothetical protein UT14_C0029G0009 [Candidatus Shapirobacteria bacterium GW2011_GWE1_38_92]OGL56166.1 MAG: hypothetical protein A2410_02955 [Candidatus Shapirobacteria bacterium RIFOXYC1_FULL_38_24]OGL58391.1 MAG: hypothetical protein A2574_00240 [Candidatus Shapirobacteria bacterium RIFOXYD1_FULL_38_32]HAP37530.1 hypothetical protein [Candidatus Shapirobacteria bacterium]
MPNSLNLRPEDNEFIKSMRATIDEEMDDEFKAELLMDLEQGIANLSKMRVFGDSRIPQDIWADWEKNKLDSEDLANII